MSFITQRFLAVSMTFAGLAHAAVGMSEDQWNPEQAIRMPIAEEPMDLGRFIRNLSEVSDNRRGEWVFEALQAGYMPQFLHTLQPIRSTHAGHQLNFWVTSDYLGIGDNDNYRHVSLSGRDALSLAASWNMYLPTRRMVDLIYQQAPMLMPSEPLAIDTIKDPMKLWLQHEESMDQDLQQLALHSGWVQAGHMKDLVLTPRLLNQPSRAAIYGWQGTDGQALQNLVTSISTDYSDYSMGVRLVAPYCLVDGRWMTVADVLRSPELAPLLSDEGSWDVNELLKLDALPPPPALQVPAGLLVRNP